MMNPAAFGAMMRGDLDNALIAATPGGIEAQEASEQRCAIRDSLLPRTLNHLIGRDADSKPLYEALGFKVSESKDELFYSVVMPKGWKIVPTDHSMHSEVQFNGSTQLTMFYKGAFYDRRADLSIHEPYAIPFEVTQDELCDKKLSPERLAEMAGAMLNRRGKVHNYYYKRDWDGKVCSFQSLDWPELTATRESATDWDAEERFCAQISERALASDTLAPLALPTPEDYQPSVLVIEWLDGTRKARR